MNYLDHFEELEKYGDYSPTEFDIKGLAGERNGINNFRIVLQQNRDSGVSERANWKAALNIINVDNEHVQIHRFGHWACGWFELLLVSDNAPDEIKEKAAEIVCSLADYPILDEELNSEMESEEALEIWKNCYDKAERIEYIRENRHQFEFHGITDILSCVRGDHFAGYPSELIY